MGGRTCYVSTDLVGHNLSDTHRHHVLIVDLWTVLHTEFCRYVYDLLPSLIHMPCSSGSLVIDIETKAKYIFYAAVMLFYVPPKSCLNKSMCSF
jgi:hypothetical protein